MITYDTLMVTLTEGGARQACIRLPESALSRSGLSKSDEQRVRALRVGERYTDTSGDTWQRLGYVQ